MLRRIVHGSEDGASVLPAYGVQWTSSRCFTSNTQGGFVFTVDYVKSLPLRVSSSPVVAPWDPTSDGLASIPVKWGILQWDGRATDQLKGVGYRVLPPRPVLRNLCLSHSHILSDDIYEDSTLSARTCTVFIHNLAPTVLTIVYRFFTPHNRGPELLAEKSVDLCRFILQPKSSPPYQLALALAGLLLSYSFQVRPESLGRTPASVTMVKENDVIAIIIILLFIVLAAIAFGIYRLVHVARHQGSLTSASSSESSEDMA
ncbi:hypothetical protein CHU98_g10467 [Xylaria longipes]|nr:hypothetical protein CHU98_g10467 [Xylaria longipes]